ncbi:hypothetical protein B0I35DRAFT_420839 [Stachybotrys elegans]|uniref:Uncharacterized protein n=1 Tax=Stachybotrys elegans TaxID=80388 RepID=A0A8K0WW93_9HYPO|nr:hypothetical protein B0I35DRAFT_420839 [Stachybotrys elegans]
MATTADCTRHNSLPSAKADSASFLKAVLLYTDMYTAAHIHLNTPSSHTDYFFQWKMWRLSVPQLLLHRGASKHGPVINFAKYKPLSRTMQLGLGDPSKRSEDGQLEQMELTREKNFMFRSDYQFSTSVGRKDGTSASFRWRKNRQMRFKTVYDCVDEDSQVVAKLFSGGMVNAEKGAEIELLIGLDQSLQEVLLMSALAVWAMESMEVRSILRVFLRVYSHTAIYYEKCSAV